MRRVALIAAAAAALAAAPAGAQLAPGRSGSSTVSYMSNAEAMRELTIFGRCFAKRQRNAALSLLATRPSSREEALTYRKLFTSDNQLCLAPSTSLGAPLAYVRGAIAEGMYDAGGGIPDELRLPAPTAAEVRNLSDAARCYAVRHPDEVRTLLTVKPGTKDEFQAVSKAMEGFGVCIPEGVDFKFDATVIRYRLAEAMLRLGAVAAPSGS